jgi:hypothetical protein
MTTKLPSELSGSIPRAVTLTKGGKALMVFAILLAVGGIVAPIVMSVNYARSVEQAARRAREAVTVDAPIVSVVFTGGEQKRTIVTYRYEVDRRRYTGRAVFRRTAARGLETGGQIRIQYIPSQPENSWRVGSEPGTLAAGLIPIVSLALLAFAGGLAWTIRRQWILLSEGRVAFGKVTAQKKVQGHNHKYYRVAYEFETLSGARVTVRVDVNRTPPAIGTRVPVIYHRDMPRWSTLYPLRLVRPVRAAQRM